MKKTVLLFGGRSAEHDVSLSSAAYLLPRLRERTEAIFPVFISRDGALTAADTYAPLSLVYESGALSFVSSASDALRFTPELAISLLHGTHGEDGDWQGLLSLAGIPCVGAGVLASSLAMHKPTAKRLAKSVGIPSARFVTVKDHESVENALPYPVFIKPATGGSSLGASKATDRASLIRAIKDARCYGEVMAEAYVACRELSVAVYEKDGEVCASPVGETVAEGGFYDYGAKYEKDTAFLCPAPIEQKLSDTARAWAKKLFCLFGIRDMARVDFFLDPSGALLFNEINTLPGYTEHSLYPRLLAAAGEDPLLPFKEAWS